MTKKMGCLIAAGIAVLVLVLIFRPGGLLGAGGSEKV